MYLHKVFIYCLFYICFALVRVCNKMQNHLLILRTFNSDFMKSQFQNLKEIEDNVLTNVSKHEYTTLNTEYI